MRLYLADRLVRHHVTVTYFFRLAYVWRFGKDADVQWDVANYMAGGDPPPYVQAYVQHIQEKERENAVPSLS